MRNDQPTAGDADDVRARPILFLTQFWGKRYREYFVNLCLPSLLAPGNLPLLDARDGHCFLIAAPREDWAAIEQLPVMQKLRSFVMPVLLETPPPDQSDYAATLGHQTLGLKRLFEDAYARRGFGCAVWPDTIMSDGFVASIERWIASGHHLVMQPTIRLSEEPVLADLRAAGLLPNEEELSRNARALCVPPRVVADLSVRHLHPEVICMEQGHPDQPTHPPYRIWRVLGGRGLILHVFFATPVLMDFAAVPPDHAQCLDSGDWETHYVGRNFSNLRLYVVSDSDEAGILSITPADTNRAELQPVTSFPGKRALSQLCGIRASLGVYGRQHGNAIRRDMFQASVRWHAGDLDDVWKREEERISAFIERAAGDYYSGSKEFPPRFTFDPRYAFLDLINEMKSLGSVFQFCMETIVGALSGGQQERARVRRWLTRVSFKTTA